jgi:hypothetical protein
LGFGFASPAVQVIEVAAARRQIVSGSSGIRAPSLSIGVKEFNGINNISFQPCNRRTPSSTQRTLTLKILLWPPNFQGAIPFMIERHEEIAQLRGLLRRHRVVGIIGARQVGKTTLARMLSEQWHGRSSFFDLESIEDQARLADPMLALKSLRGLVLIDEIQRLPNLFTVLRVLADRPARPASFLVLGSASPDLLRQSSESLAGRIFYHEIGGFTLDEAGAAHHEKLWLRGGLPRSYLARSLTESNEWRPGFIRAFLERDLPQLGIGVSATAMRRCWTMLAHYHGQVWNVSEFARSLGVADTTVRGYVDRLTSALVVRQLLPWHENISKRQVKSPKVYVADSGLLHSLLNIRSMPDLESHPRQEPPGKDLCLIRSFGNCVLNVRNAFSGPLMAVLSWIFWWYAGQLAVGFRIQTYECPAYHPCHASIHNGSGIA